MAFAAHQVARTSVSQYVVAAACNRAVAAGAALLQAPVAKPWGQTVAHVRAPDGTLVELCTPMD